ncbi:Uma2 family endonuclease [Thermostichus vulcanus]|uniref:Uma2 family endonuclease n=1 Tax=Thermostichus vulcanus str. 'Rupite' TaxID=2813851 RepID=A0ABT0CF55_THEVL|nr:Uma2 family endonuclease [Thermostichus vulcanus]MCJ2544417.1 Uma2 family endonuclease [Thermostichus vulcanus str. 'Rupite']
MTALTLDLTPLMTLTREDFIRLCAANPELKLERTARGELIIMAPTGGETGNLNFEIGGEVFVWNRQVGKGKSFDSSTGFSLPSGSDRSPDLAWIPIEKWEALDPEVRQGFLPLCPDFVVEILSPTDSWGQTQAKMQEYMDNGCRLGWLLDPKTRRVMIYREGQAPQLLEDPETLSGEAVLPGFTLPIRKIWSA